MDVVKHKLKAESIYVPAVSLHLARAPLSPSRNPNVHQVFMVLWKIHSRTHVLYGGMDAQVGVQRWEVIGRGVGELEVY